MPSALLTAAVPPQRELAIPSLQLEQVTRSFVHRRAVDDVTLDVRDGELFALLGPSGSGKTTLLRLIAGFEAPEAGMIAIAGRHVAGGGVWVEPQRRGVGFVPQGDALFPHMTVAENVAFGVRGNLARVVEALELVDLADRGGSRPSELSGGERQRVALARALAPRPSLVLLDEPFSSLDANLRGRLRRDVVEILRRAGATGVLVTHDQDEALGLADRVAIMRSGRIVQSGAPTELYWRPADAWTARFLGEVNVLAAEVGADGADTLLGRFAVPGTGAHGSCHVGVRPEQLVLSVGEAGDAVVAGREFRGHDVLYELLHPSAGRILVQLPSLELYDPGQHVRVVPHARAAAAVLAASS